MTTTQTVEELLRPLAELRVRVWEAPGPEPLGGTLFAEELDPRFDALRWPIENDEGGGWRIDASLGAIARALAASGYTTITLWFHDWWHARLGDMRSWDGITPEEALARALVAVWGGAKATSTTAPGAN